MRIDRKPLARARRLSAKQPAHQTTKLFMKNALILLLTFGFLGGGILQAQPITQSSYEENLKAARKAYANNDFINALERYETAYDDRDDKSLRDTIAYLEFAIRDYRSAERTYRSILRRADEGEKDHLRFNYGRLLKINEKYEDAIAEFEQFLKTNPGDSLETLAKNEMAGIELAQELPDNLKGVSVDFAGRDINMKTSEYTPALAKQGNEVYFAGFDADDVIYMELESEGKEGAEADSGARSDGKKDKKKDKGGEEDVNKYALIFKANRDDSEWGERQPLGGEVNRPEYHNSNVALSKDGRTMYFTRAKLQGNTLEESKLFYSVDGGGSWQGANEIKGINGEYLAKHPAPGELFGKQVLFFASDMEGGYGGFDIYYATRIGEGEYGDPVNLGETINGPGDEVTPYYREGNLYFASTTHPGLGGFDLFYSTWDGSDWSPVLNMGRGYNTSYDDKSFTLDEEGYFGMLTSNRPEGGRSAYGRTCCDDLFTIDIARIVVDIVVGTFTKDKKPLTGATVNLVPMKGEPNSQATGDKSNVVGFDLALETEYLLIGTHPDYYPDTVRLNTVGVTESKSLEHRFYLEAKPVPPPEPKFDTIYEKEPIVLENILYEFDDDRIEEEAETDLQVVYGLMTEYPDMVIELSSHTDNRGDDNYNEDLSQRRAESARRWLVREGIDRDRIVAKGYGESQPQTVSPLKASRYDFLEEGDVLTGEFIEALESEEQQEAAHSLNRRTEFTILEGPKVITIKRIKKKEKVEKTKDRGRMPGADQGNKKPVIKFTQESLDFGKVRKGEKRKHTFIFYNAGEVPFTIDLISACDCTSFEEDLTGETFQPGEKGRLPIIFDSSEKEESETIDIDIYLQETDENGMQIIKTVQYKFDLVK